MTASWNMASIGDLTGTTAVVTGANSGLGFHTSLALAAKGARVLMACRSRSKAESAVATIRARLRDPAVEIVDLDLADLNSVDEAAVDITGRTGSVQLLVNNAGIMAPPRRETAQGFESQFGTNHLGHFALTAQLFPLLVAGDRSRVVTVSSIAHRKGWMNWDDLQHATDYDAWTAYRQSKLANLLFTVELARRLDETSHDIVALAAHPGVSATNLFDGMENSVAKRIVQFANPVLRKVFQSAEAGALPVLRAATDPQAGPNDYYGPNGPGEIRGKPVRVGRRDHANDAAAAQKLWEISEELTGTTFSVA